MCVCAGIINANYMRELLITKGTPFREKEVEGFMSVAKDLETQNIYYEDYVALITAENENIGK
jgi:calmodulin